MLLMGIWISLTKNPMNPIIANPTAVAITVRVNSAAHDPRRHKNGKQFKKTVARSLLPHAVTNGGSLRVAAHRVGLNVKRRSSGVLQ